MNNRLTFFLKGVAPALALLLAYLGFETAQHNLMGWVLVLVGIGYLVGGILYFQRQKNSATVRSEEKGDRSFWMILPGFVAVFFGPPLEALYLPELLPQGDGVQAAGVTLLGSGIGLRVWTRLALRSLYTGHVQVVTGHHLVRSGPYRYVRHPGYAGFILMALGLCIGYSSLIGLAGLTFLLIPALVYRMRVEEHLLLEEFGTEYQEYAQTTHRFIPGAW